MTTAPKTWRVTMRWPNEDPGPLAGRVICRGPLGVHDPTRLPLRSGFASKAYAEGVARTSRLMHPTATITVEAAS